jgi:hypothetical protein
MISSILDLLGGGGGGSFDKSQLIAPEKALKGRAQKMPNIDGLKHYVLGNKIDHVPEGHQVAVFANGVRFVVGLSAFILLILVTFVPTIHIVFSFRASFITVLLGIRKGHLEIAQGYLFHCGRILCWIYTESNL